MDALPIFIRIFIGIRDAPDDAGSLEEMNESRLLDHMVQLSSAEQGEIVAVVAQLLAKHRQLEHRAVSDPVLEVLSGHARVVVSLLSGVKQRARSSSEADRVGMAVRFLEANASRPVSLDTVAEHVGWSKWHCARVFKRHTGSGIAEFCRRVRLDTARRLLADRSLTVKEVAAAAGFTHPSDLTRCFLRAYGISPSRFRRLHQLASAPWSIDRTNSQQKARD